jgi:hypothetical protein
LQRLLLAALPALLLLASCGGGAAKPTADSTVGPTATLTSAERTRVALTPVALPTVKDQPLPTPVKLAPDDVLVIVVAGKERFAPKSSDFGALPTVEITVAGKTYKGVTLAALAEKVKAPSGVNVTIDGTRADRVRLGTIRFPAADIAATTVLVADETGHLSLYSTSVPQEQWLVLVTGISFN